MNGPVNHIERSATRRTNTAEEPLLGRRLQIAAGYLCRNEWDVEREWSPFKSRLADLVGFHSRHRRHPVLGGYEAYRLA